MTSTLKVHRITVSNRNTGFLCPENKTLLLGMEQNAAKCIDVGCRGGGCGVCKIRIISGDYDCKVMSKAQVTEQEQQAGYALACRVFPRSEMVIESDCFKATTSEITAISASSQNQ